MPNVTSVEQSLKRLLKLCPDITLDTRAIQLIIDGEMNQVICEFRTGEKIEEQVIEEVCMGTCSTTDAGNIEYDNTATTVTTEIADFTSNEPRAFDDYFKD